VTAQVRYFWGRVSLVAKGLGLASAREPKRLAGFLDRAMTNAVRYRHYFEDARKRAEQSAYPVEKQAWMRMAEKWLKLLALADQHAGPAAEAAMKEAAH
jgi:hypothetical protein